MPDWIRNWLDTCIAPVVGPRWVAVIIAVMTVAWAIFRNWDKITGHPLVFPLIS